ncbi:hypothetical protein [Xylophilus sp. Leaf220]|uniref:hypothetical protein n=1 Tax=Xylophilus sp. Leaf220 TaxID=1735686 RepID=UPI00070120BD|nr:hypothetical protein [Xylophilus sp. Leaf220]KQM79435.1 hypothetical protein ASE76_15275 [Xylophilus sp. Leaf220]
MTSFVHPQFSSQHVGANRAVRTVEHVSGLVQGARGGASLLLAAVVSAVLVVANQVVDTWSEGHLLTAWAVLWAIAFAALALLAGPLRRAAITLRATVFAWNERQIAAEQDRQMMRVAMTDARVMADISRAMSMGAARDVRNYF